VEQSSLEPCVPCNCSGPGIAGTDELGGDCVMNDETALSLPGMASLSVRIIIIFLLLLLFFITPYTAAHQHTNKTANN